MLVSFFVCYVLLLLFSDLKMVQSYGINGTVNTTNGVGVYVRNYRKRNNCN